MSSTPLKRLTPIRVLQDGPVVKARELYTNNDDPPWITSYLYGDWFVVGVVLTREEGISWRAFNPLTGQTALREGLSELLQSLDRRDEDEETWS